VDHRKWGVKSFEKSVASVLTVCEQ